MKIEKCPECNGKIRLKNEDYILLGFNLGKFKTMVCDKCGLKLYDEETMDKIDVVAKKMGLWGLEPKTKLNELGNSLAIRLNKNIVNLLKLKKGEEILVYPENKNKIIVEIPSKL